MGSNSVEPDPWESLIEQLPVGVTISHYPTDDPADGYLVAANPAASRVLGFDLAPFIGVAIAREGFDDRFDKEETDATLQMSYQVAVGGTPMALDDFEVAHGPGQGHFQSTIFPLPGRRAASVFRRIDREVAAREALDWAMSSLETANRSLASFASTVAHDLKNPLSGISGNAELVKMTTSELPVDAVRALDRIAELATASAAMIDGLLQFAKAPAAIALESIHVGGVVDWATNLLGDQITSTAAIVVTRGNGHVFANRAAIRQVILNLLSNSLSYNHPERSLRVSIDVTLEPEHVTIWVVDNGVGIDPAMHERVFEWGIRDDNEGAAPSGSGLGLAACRAALSSLGGTIAIAESNQAGTKIRMTLPSVE